MKKLFGTRLRTLRLARSLTQLQLAQRVGISDRHLSRMERGLVSPSFECLENLCQALGTAPAELFQFRDQTPHALSVRAVREPQPSAYGAAMDTRGNRSGFGDTGMDERRQSRNALIEALQEKDAILKSLPGLTVKCVDQDMRLVWVSTADPDSSLTNAPCAGRTCYEAAHGRNTPCPGCLLPVVLQTGEPREGEVVVPSGRAFLTRCNPVYSPDGTLKGAIHVALDISARKHTEEQLRLVQQRLEHLLNTGPAVLYACKADENYGATYISDNMLSLFGHPAQAFIDNPLYWFSQLYPGEKERLRERLPLLFEQDSLVREYRFRHGNGGWRFIRDDLRLVRDEDGNPKEIVGSWLDITDAKASELAMRDSESRYKNLFMTNCTVQLLLDAESGAILDANPAACAFYGYSHQEIRRKTIADINTLPPDELAKELEIARSLGKTLFRFRHRLANGELRDVESRVSLMAHGGRAVLHSLIIDVTEQMQAQNELRELHGAWEMFFDHAPNALALLDEHLCILRGNRLLAMALGADGRSVEGALCLVEPLNGVWPQPGESVASLARVRGFEPTIKVTITALEPKATVSLRYLMVSEQNFKATGA